ncbi:nuclear transport factor 2 family protein [Pseudonocardia kunmingensis]|uniref:SnoaL-like protein n=1 Tax=Pseudonocardia kunmingensis TaxID=630975 RepID=A0A543CYG9_9PSEU|nr:nuclear transport factor 2 family protein [Pseudonocardia kunmingensis]TQM02119.1 SnoaL-like protein [Pseudonocardia kunmingensis]
MTGEGLVRAYFAACSRGDVVGVAASFCPDAVVYDTNHRPVRGPEAIAAFFAKVRERWDGATWHVDTFVGDGRTAAVEWTMLVRRDGATVPVRGSEHYEFADGRIRQIRQYWTHRPDDPEVGLRDYPYDEDPRFHTAG